MLGLFSKEKLTGNKKIIENLVLFLVLFIIVIIVMNVLNGESSKNGQTELPLNTVVANTSVSKEMSTEEKLENILSFIDGAGKVKVFITYANGVEQVPMYNTKQNTTTTQEEDSNGGIRKTEETNQEQSVIFNENGNAKTPVIKQTISPEVIGVIVVADGADRMEVKENLLKAVEASLNVASHRIQVFAGKK